jgi:gas vesicle protein
MKQIIKLNEEELQYIIKESVNKILNETTDEGLVNTIRGFAGRQGDKISNTFSNAYNQGKERVQNVANKVSDTVTDVYNQGKEKIQNATNQIKNDWQSSQRDAAYQDMVSAFNQFQKYWQNYLKNGGKKSGISKQLQSQITSINKALNNYQTER